MKASHRADEYFKERQKILHSYFKDTIDILSASYSSEQISDLFETLSFPLEKISEESHLLTFDDYLKLIDQIKISWDSEIALS